MLKLCYEKERAEAYYRLGFCFLFGEDWADAWSNFMQPRTVFVNIGQAKNRLVWLR